MSGVIITTALAMALGTYVSTIMHAQEGSFHISVMAKARAAEQQIVKYIQLGRAVSADTDRMILLDRELVEGHIQFVDEDGNVDTVEDNRLVYDPDVDRPGDEVVVCDWVSPIPGEPMFQVTGSSPNAALIAFHVGEVPGGDDDADLLTAEGYQGVEVRLAATPRNRQIFYE